jgi:cytochrome c biogenesis protein ResB
MRWLMIGLLVSLVGLLFAAAAVARHIWLRRKSPEDGAPVEPSAAKDADVELEP